MIFNAYLIFMVSYFLRFTSRFPVLGQMRLEFLIGVILLLGMFFIGKFQNLQVQKDDTAKWLVYFVAFAILSIPLVEWPGSVIRFNLVPYMKAVFFFILTMALVDSEKKLKIFVAVFLSCQLFRVVEPAYLHITQGYWGDAAYSVVGGSLHKLNRLCGAPHDIVNSNQLAWVANNTIPFLFYLGWQQKKVFLKLAAAALLGLCLYVLMLTGSRSGLISLLITIAGILWLGENRLKRFTVGLLIIVPVFFLVSAQMDMGLKERYRSIFDRSAVGGDTASGRIKGLKTTLNTVWNAPIFGHGIGTSSEVNVNVAGGRAQLAHNLYIEVLQEVGIAGFLLFMLYIRSIVTALLSAKRRLDDATASGFTRNLVYALLVWTAMNLVYSLSCFGLNSWEWYLFGGVSTVCLKLAKESAQNECVRENLA